jgi:hypothetical protein
MSLTQYTLSNVSVNDSTNLELFLVNILPRNTRYNSLSYDPVGKTLTVYTKENSTSSTTQSILTDAVRNKYPNPPIQDDDWQTGDVAAIIPTNILQSASVYGYFPSTTAIDGDVVVSKNLTLTRNMYYRTLTINAGVQLNANGWRIVITDTLTLNGTISNDGTDASGVTGGTGSSIMYTTYLGPGTNGGAGLTGTGGGASGVAAQYSCCGGVGGLGGDASSQYKGGSGGAYQAISPVDGGINTLSTMPVAFLGRMLSSNYYLMGGTGGGGGACYKSGSATVKSGAGGGGGGLIIIAAKNVVGSGTVSAHGGAGSAASLTGTNTGGIGGGGGGGGGCIIIISQSGTPTTITINVVGGPGGAGISPGTNGTAGSAGNVFQINV